MPLFPSKSKKAVGKNIKTEMEAGKPQDQAIAIAYDIQRKNKRKKMAKGGEVKDEFEDISPVTEAEMMEDEDKDMPSNIDRISEKDIAIAYGKPNPNEDDDNLSKGGSVKDQHDDSDAEGHYDSIASAIMARKRKAKMMAEGGMVDLDENAQEEPNNLDDLNYEALKKENYAEEHGLSAMGSPEDSNEDGHDLSDEDKHDMVTMIRRKIKAKRG